MEVPILGVSRARRGRDHGKQLTPDWIDHDLKEECGTHRLIQLSRGQWRASIPVKPVLHKANRLLNGANDGDSWSSHWPTRSPG